jgi:hypothetical protein
MASRPAARKVRTYAGQGYNPTYLARKHGLSRQQAQALIKKLGHDRDKLNEAAAALGSRPCSGGITSTG